jgi:hypothetical protein
MSTTSIEETQTPALDADPAAALAADTPTAADAPPAEARPADPAVKTFRGRTLEELLPQIREQLGPDAIVVRQRDGLMGGIGGFFQQRFVEVDAKRGGPLIDVYDEQPAPTPESFAALLAGAEADGEADAVVIAAAFAPPVGDSQPPALPEPAFPDAQAPAPPPAAELPPASEPAPLDAQAPAPLAAELQRSGMSATFAERLVADAEAHELPFAQGDLRRATRRALARRVPTSLPHRAGSLAVAFAGPGSTACADALATAYRQAGRDARALASLDRAQARLDRAEAGGDAVLALDLPPIATEPAEVAALAERLDRLTLDEIVAVIPADLDLLGARALLDRVGPLDPTALALDADGTQLGAALELACSTRLPVAYVQDAGTIAPADPTALAARLLP